MAFVEVRDIVLHVHRSGDPRGPLVVFANSLGTDARIWDAVVARLPDRYGVLCYDKRGHGLSDAPPGPCAIADHADDLVGVLDHFGAHRVALVGLSIGGMIAQAIAARHPDRIAALVLCDTAARIGTAETWNARIAAVESQGLPAIADSVLQRWFTRVYRETEAACLRGWHNMLVRQPVTGYAASCAAIRDADLRDQAAGITAPTLCLVGDQDLSTPPDLVRDTAALIPGARFEVIARSGHLPCIEQPEDLAALVTRHFADAGYR
ncbi:MAG: 3-oxoadipate enol-lactonase [Azospirillaceae bacterium]|nr:3-oxoadipate enol-lactonase [Azospirillaceae bacterium]